MSSINLLSKIQGCLCGVAIGDAMGMPFEMMTPSEIFFATGGQGVTNFSHAVQRTITGTGQLRAGEITDDFQLTRAIARAIIKSGKLDSMAIAREHVVEFNQSTLGWGKSTKSAIEAMRDHFNAWDKNNQNSELGYMQSLIDEAIKDTPGTGNGVAMKSAPIAIFHIGFIDYDYLFDNIVMIGKLTHRDPRASYAACAVAGIIKDALESNQLITTHRSVSVNMKLICKLTELEIMRSNSRSYRDFSGDSFVSRLINIFSTDIIDCSLNQIKVPAELIKRVGTSCFALESIPFSIAIFLRNLTDFRAGVLEAVNCGGDTDSNASMVGAMIGANVGLEGIPKEWLEAVPACQEALQLAEGIYQVLEAKKNK